MTHPICHSNGTSREALIRDYRVAYQAAKDAIKAINAIEFNSRDYYPVPGSWEKARAEMEDRVQALQTIAEDFRDIAVKIQRENPKKSGMPNVCVLESDLDLA